jgi:hypothetical protein
LDYVKHDDGLEGPFKYAQIFREELAVRRIFAHNELALVVIELDRYGVFSIDLLEDVVHQLA